MSHVFPRHTSQPLPIVLRGEGVYLLDSNGRRYFDGSCGAATSCLGHNDQRVIEAIQSQLETVAYAHTGFFTSEPAELLADRLIGEARRY